MTDDEFGVLLKILRQDADQAASFLGFLRATVDNKIMFNQLNDSYSGTAAAVAINGVTNCLVLYCARAWDRPDDAISLRRAAMALPARESIQQRQRQWVIYNSKGDEKYGRLYDERERDRVGDLYDKFFQTYSDVEKNPYHPHMRVLRTELFAHRVLYSKDRKKFEQRGVNIIGAYHRDLMDLADSTLKLVGDLGFLWDRLMNPYAHKILREERHTREFWRLQPIFRDVETIDW